jgi:hypothetical protein
MRGTCTEQDETRVIAPVDRAVRGIARVSSVETGLNMSRA